MKNRTDYQLVTSMHEGIFEIVITGELTTDAVNKLHAEVIAIISAQHAKAVLCDIRAAKGPHEFAEAYFRARSIPQDVKKLPAAVVELSEYGDYQSFYETTAANAGHLMKFFTDIEAARAWLKSKLKLSGPKN